MAAIRPVWTDGGGMEIFGYAPWGYEGQLVRVEVDLKRGIPGLEIVGLPGSAVREARERIRIALQRSGFQFPPDRMLVNLSPADLPKTGSGYDLPLALALLVASGQWQAPEGPLLAMGELSLDGRLHRVPGTLAAAARAAEAGIRKMAIPLEALHQTRELSGLQFYAGGTLDSLVSSLRANSPVQPRVDSAGPCREESDLVLKGQPQVVKALQVAAAGGHSMLLYGPPGSGKTLAARTLEQLLPPLDNALALETSRLWSLAGKLTDGGLLNQPPFRDPHHSASTEGVLGGGPQLSPGEISLSHNGILFLDEAPEFSPRVLQSLREPLETGQVQVVRAGKAVWYPSRFLLVMTANGCPCGQSGKEKGLCFCTSQEIRRYWDRIGNALMDRVDLRVFVTPAPVEEVLGSSGVRVDSVRRSIAAARKRQASRGQPAGQSNAALPVPELIRTCALSDRQQQDLATWAAREDWSTRATHSVMRVALTLADLEGEASVSRRHLSEAAALRRSKGGEPWLH